MNSERLHSPNDLEKFTNHELGAALLSIIVELPNSLEKTLCTLAAERLQQTEDDDTLLPYTND